ncbi:MAG TPA: squalene/phytoene synthase family protein [Nocardioidaceae bacterium]|nr:squalene/phytoene synthase family protein [Nocardioidaceae bacterium]
MTALQSSVDVSHAYDVCEAITREQARNFFYGIRLLRPAKRRALSVAYATSRRIDDIVDSDLDDGQKLHRLEELSESLHRIEDPGAIAGDPVLVALRDTAHRFPLPMGTFDELIEGCRADVTVHRYPTWQALEHYCRCVAGSVGRMSVGIYHPRRLDECWQLADALGIALQLTNILRDLREDRLVGRIYLPAEDLERFGCTLELDDAGRLADPADRFTALVRFEAERAEAWYARGLQLLPLLDRRSAACTAAMAGIYHRLLRSIAADPDLVRDRRLSLPTAAKLGVAARALVRGAA